MRFRDRLPAAGRRAWLVPLLLLAAALACNMPGDDLVVNINIGEAATGTPAAALAPTLTPAPDAAPAEPVLEGGLTLREALAVPPQDGRPEALRLLGPPDTFRLTFLDLEGQTVRLEEWSYYDYETRLDFVDGELLWTLDLEPLPDGAVFAQFYDPLDFNAYEGSAAVRARLAGMSLAEESLAELDYPGAVLLAGPQILLGFDQDRLVSAETFALSPEAAR